MGLTCIETDLHNLCRTCSRITTTHYYHLYQEINVNRGPKKPYFKLLNELLNVNLPSEEGVIEPIKLCKKCVTLLTTIYKFILQAQRLHEEYTKQTCKRNVVEKVKAEDCLKEPPIDITQPSTEISGIKCEESPFKSLEYIELKKSDAQTLDDTIKQECHLFPCEEVTTEENLKNVRTLVLEDVNEVHNKDEDIPGHHISNKCKFQNSSSEKSNNDNLPIRCDLCNKIYKNRKTLKKHKYYTHMTDEEKLRCTLCEFKTSRNACLKMHMKTRHGPETIDKYFKLKNKPTQRFPCNRCTRKYCRKDDLKRHIKEKHINFVSLPQKSKYQKPQHSKDFHLCDFCGQSYTTINSLRMHSRQHTDERPYKCDLCNKAFRRHQDMKTHRVIHSDDKPHQCVECGKSFKRPDKLRTHMRVHSELRPYKCNECAKTFKYSYVLKTHMYIHTGQKPFECKTCNENFSLRTTLNAHCLKYNHIKKNNLLKH